jgi:hypothetical protein
MSVDDLYATWFPSLVAMVRRQAPMAEGDAESYVHEMLLTQLLHEVNDPELWLAGAASHAVRHIVTAARKRRTG